MYPQKFSQPILLAKHNLTNVLLENSFSNNRNYFTYTLFLRKTPIGFKSLKDVNNDFFTFIKNDKVYKLLYSSIRNIPRTWKNQSSGVLKVWAHQCECVLAQRLRRTQQMFCMYSKLWEEKALKELLQRMRQQWSRKGKNLVLGAVGISSFNWEANRISEDELRRHLNELEYVYKLKENTICLECTRAQSNINTSVCTCGTAGKIPTNKSFEDWTPFLEKNDLLVWRKLLPSGHYEYKVFGSYKEVFAEDFLNVQIDIDYRRKWDTTAVILESVESDPLENANSDVIYWEMLWPRLFVNRDYVFTRRYLVDHETKTLLIVNKCISHPSHPKYPDKYRVEDYWSYMVIKPHSDLEKPGLEFCLTYYDNPGVNIPSSVTTWVAMRAMPDYLERLREATSKYRQYCIDEGVTKACKIVQEEERRKREEEEKNRLDYCSFSHKMKRKASFPKPEFGRKTRPSDSTTSHKTVDTGTVSPETKSATNKQADDGFWKYLHPTYYIS